MKKNDILPSPPFGGAVRLSFYADRRRQENNPIILKSKWFRLLIPFSLFCLTFLLRIPTFYKPFDLVYESQLAFLGKETFVGDGFYAVPWTQKPAGETLTYGLLYVLFGSENWVLAVRVCLAFLSALATLFIYLLGRKLFGGWAGFTAALFFSVFFSRADIFSSASAYAEMLMPFFVVLGYYLFFVSYEKKNQLLLFLSGLSFGVSLLYKQSALYSFAPLFLWSVKEGFSALKKKKQNLDSILSSHLPLILGFILPMAIFVFYIFFIGKINFLQDWMIKKPMLYSKLREKHPFPYILTILKKTYPVFMLAFLGTLFSFFRRQSKRSLFVLWLLFTPLTFITSGKFWNYYFIQLFIPICFLAGIFIEDLWSLGKKWTTNTFLLRTAFLLGIILLLVPLNKKYYNKEYYQALLDSYFFFLRKKVSKTDYPVSLSIEGQWKMRFEAAEFLKENLGPRDSLFVLEEAPGLYVLVDKMPAYKEFLFEQQFFENKVVGFAFMHSFETYEGNRNKLMENLGTHPPAFIALVIDSPNIVPVQFKEFPQFFSFVFKNYDLVKNINDIWIYKLGEEKVEIPQNLVVDFEFVKKYFLVTNSSGKKIILEPFTGESYNLEAALTAEGPLGITFSPLEVEFLGADGRDFVSPGSDQPSGRIDFHLRIAKEPKAIKMIRIKKGNILWIYPSTGENLVMKVIENLSSFDLYFEPPSNPEGEYNIFIIYQDSSISKAEINVKKGKKN